MPWSLFDNCGPPDQAGPLSGGELYPDQIAIQNFYQTRIRASGAWVFGESPLSHATCLSKYVAGCVVIPHIDGWETVCPLRFRRKHAVERFKIGRGRSTS